MAGLAKDYTRVCDKCGGLIAYGRDHYGGYMHCVSCGKEFEVRWSRQGGCIGGLHYKTEGGVCSCCGVECRGGFCNKCRCEVVGLVYLSTVFSVSMLKGKEAIELSFSRMSEEDAKGLLSEREVISLISSESMVKRLEGFLGFEIGCGAIRPIDFCGGDILVIASEDKRRPGRWEWWAVEALFPQSVPFGQK